MPKLLALRRKIGVLFQDGALFGSMSVFDNVAFPLRQHTDTLGGADRRAASPSACADVGLADAIDDLPSQLSGGMRKRAGLRAGARDGAGHRDLRRARLGPGPGAHGAAVRADPGDARDPRRHLHRRHPRHRLGAAGSASTSRCCGGGGSWKRATRSGCSPRRTRSCASSSADRRRAR